jgi:AI-2 transport protein TqsA
MNLNLTSATRIGLNILGLLGITVALYLGKSIWIPLIIAALLAVILFPVVSWLNSKMRLSWMMAIFVALGVIIALNLSIFIGMASIIPRILQNVPGPNDLEMQKEVYRKVHDKLELFSPVSIEDVIPRSAENSNVFRYFQELLRGQYITDQLIELGKGGAGWLWQSILIFFILMFLMMEGRMLATRIKEIFGDSTVTQGHVTETLADIGHAIRSYLVWRTIINLGLAVTVGIVYQIAGLQFPWTWAMLTGIASYVPYLGTILAGAPPFIDAFFMASQNSPWIAMGLLMFFIALTTFEGYVLVPVVMGRSMDLNATTVLLSCLFWELMWGIPGLFLAMPLMAAIKSVCMHVPGWEGWGNLMSTEEGVELAKEEAREREIQHQQPVTDATVIMDLPDLIDQPSNKP